MLIPAWLAMLLAVGGGVAAILGARKLAVALVTPAVFKFVVWPLAAPALAAALTRIPLWTMVVLFPVAAIFGGVFLLLAGLLMLQSGTAAIFGRHTASVMTGHLLANLAQGVGRTLLSIPAWLARRLVRPFVRRDGVGNE